MTKYTKYSRPIGHDENYEKFIVADGRSFNKAAIHHLPAHHHYQTGIGWKG